MQYQYVAYTLQQGMVKGKLEAADEADVRAQLLEQGVKPLRITRAMRLPNIEKIIPGLLAVKGPEVITFVKTLTTMLASGANLLRILEMLQAEATSRGMKAILADLHETVSEGGSFTEGLKHHLQVFDEVFTSLSEVGEFTGQIGPALEKLAEMIGQAAEAKKKAAAAMMMPMVMIGASFAMLGFMVFVMLPPLLSSFEKMDVAIPMQTIIMMTTITWIGENVVAVFLAIVGTFGAYKVLQRFPTTRYWLHMAKAKLPVLGALILVGELGKFTIIVGTLLGSGVDLPRALQLGRNATKNEVIKRAWEDASESLFTGHRMAEALENHSIIPNMFRELLAIGEESNTLPKTMGELAEAYRKELESKIEGLLAMGEMGSTAAVGGVVLFMAMSVMIPIFNAASSFN